MIQNVLKNQLQKLKMLRKIPLLCEKDQFKTLNIFTINSGN